VRPPFATCRRRRAQGTSPRHEPPAPRKSLQSSRAIAAGGAWRSPSRRRRRCAGKSTSLLLGQRCDRPGQRVNESLSDAHAKCPPTHRRRQPAVRGKFGEKTDGNHPRVPQ
jgi:hypothetical protein